MRLGVVSGIPWLPGKEIRRVTEPGIPMELFAREVMPRVRELGPSG